MLSIYLSTLIIRVWVCLTALQHVVSGLQADLPPLLLIAGYKSMINMKMSSGGPSVPLPFICRVMHHFQSISGASPHSCVQ